jgi:hypothetical protein
VDEQGGQHPVHSFLLALKIPLFRSLGKIRHVVMAGVSSDVVELIVGMVYGHDRSVWLFICVKLVGAGSLKLVSGFWSSSSASPNPLVSRTWYGSRTHQLGAGQA